MIPLIIIISSPLSSNQQEKRLTNYYLLRLGYSLCTTRIDFWDPFTLAYPHDIKQKQKEESLLYFTFHCSLSSLITIMKEFFL